MKKILYILLLLVSFKGWAADVVIGTGSGTISKTSMGSLNPGDRLLIKAGSYSAITISNLNNIAIINETTQVIVTGTWNLGTNTNITINGHLATDSAYGFTFANGSNNCFNWTGSNQGIRIYWVQASNSGVFCNISNTSTTYNLVSNSTKAAYQCTWANIHLFNSSQLIVGNFNAANGRQNYIDSIDVHNLAVENNSGNGTLITGSGIYRFNLYQWIIQYTQFVSNVDVGLCYLTGNGQMHEIRRHGGWGYIGRFTGACDLNTPLDTYLYNIIDLGSTDYGTFDVRNDSTAWGGDANLTYSKFHIYNVTNGNKYDGSITYTVAPAVIFMQDRVPPPQIDLKNIVAFNNGNSAHHFWYADFTATGGRGPITWDSAYSAYYLSAPIPGTLLDSLLTGCNISTSSPWYNTGMRFSPALNDINGNARSPVTSRGATIPIPSPPPSNTIPRKKNTYLKKI